MSGSMSGSIAGSNSGSTSGSIARSRCGSLSGRHCARSLARRPSLLAIAAAAICVGPPGAARAQVPPAPATAAPGALGQAPIAAGDVATARDRALNEAFRQLVEAAFAGLLAETGSPPSPALTSLRAGWLQRPKRLVRSYKVLEQSEDGGMLRVRVTAELDEAFMRREFDRSRGTANRGVAPGVLPVLAVGAPEAAAALVAALADQGVRAQLQPGGSTDEAALRAIATRAGRAVALVTGRAASEGPVRGTGQQAVECQLGVRLVPADGPASAERSAAARGFQVKEDDARTACFTRATRDLLPALLPDLGGGASAGDLRVVTLELDINEPAVISPVLRALRKIGGGTSTEVRRVVVGRVEVRVSSRLTAGALLAGLTRELATLATVTRTGGSDQGPRVSAQVRLLPATLPPAAAPAAPGAPAAAPAASGGAPPAGGTVTRP
jgi:hypothetical protein